MPTVNFLNDHKSLEVLPGTNVRDIALKSGIHLYRSFQRVFHLNLQLGTIRIPCGSDVIEIVEGKGVNPRSPDEEKLISGRFIKRKVTPALRLACQVQVTGDITVRTLPNLEIDKDETVRNLGFIGALGLFALLMAVTFGLMALDLVKAL